MKYAVQLYSLANYINQNGLESALKMVSEAGYEGVEFAGFYNLEPKKIHELLDKYHLKAISSHTGLEAIKNSLPYFLELNISYVIVPYIGFDSWLNNGSNIINQFKELQEFLKPYGITLGYHNHAHEFKDGNDFIAYLYKNLSTVSLEFDVCWLTIARQDIEVIMDTYHDNLKLVHIKDASNFDDVSLDVPVIGHGIVDMYTVFKKVNQYELEWAILEAENIKGDILSYLKDSLKSMKWFENATL